MKNTKRLKDMLAGAALTTLVLGLTVPVLAATDRGPETLDYSDIQLVVNGENTVLRDRYGDRVELFTLDGAAYVPARALGEALGMDVSWNGSTRTITMTGTPGALPDETGYIGAESARTAALDHAGVLAADAVFWKTKRDWDLGRDIYEVEFHCGGTEYDYDVDALTGDVLRWDHEAESRHAGGHDRDHNGDHDWDHGDYIGLEKARSLAQNKAPGATLTSCKLDWEDGGAVYEGELREGSLEYEFDIDAVTGAFLQWESDWDD